MPTHPYDGMNILRYLLDQELKKRKEPGFFKIYKNNKEAVILQYHSFTGSDVSTEFIKELLESAFKSFKRTYPIDYANLVYFTNGKIHLI